MSGIPDHPIIRNMEETGLPDRKEAPRPTCPICGRECETFYTSDYWHEIVGCDNCIISDDAYSEN